jgi:hypothetical protein
MSDPENSKPVLSVHDAGPRRLTNAESSRWCWANDEVLGEFGQPEEPLRGLLFDP